MRCRKKVTSTTMHRMPPGRYSGSMVPDTPVSPRMSFQPKLRLISAALSSGKIRDSTRNTASSRYGAQAMGTEIGALPELIMSTLAFETSTPSTSWPSCAMQQAAVKPT